MWPINWSATSVTNYISTLCNITEERRYILKLLHGTYPKIIFYPGPTPAFFNYYQAPTTEIFNCCPAPTPEFFNCYPHIFSSKLLSKFSASMVLIFYLYFRSTSRHSHFPWTIKPWTSTCTRPFFRFLRLFFSVGLTVVDVTYWATGVCSSNGSVNKLTHSHTLIL